MVKIIQNSCIEKIHAGNFHFTVNAFTQCRVYIMHIKETSVFSNFRSFNRHQLWTMTFSLSIESLWDISLCYLSDVPCGTWPQISTSVQTKVRSGCSYFLNSTEVANCEDFWMATSNRWKEKNVIHVSMWKSLSVAVCTACPWKDHHFHCFYTSLLICSSLN